MSRPVIILSVFGVVVAAAIIGYALLNSKLTPDELAMEYINGNVDELGEDIAGFVVGGNWLLKELGGEYVEDQVHKVVKWDYTPARPLDNDDGMYEVTSTAHVRFGVDVPLGSGSVEAGLPFVLTIDHGNQLVVSSEADYLAAYFETDIPDVPSLDTSADEAVDSAKDKLRRLLD